MGRVPHQRGPDTAFGSRSRFPPRAAGAALRGRGAGSAPVRRWATGRHAPGGWAGGPKKRECAERVLEQEGLCWEPAVPGTKAILVLSVYATLSRVKGTSRGRARARPALTRSLFSRRRVA